MYFTKTAIWQFFFKKTQIICQIIAYNANYAQFLSIMNIKGIDCTNQYFFTLRKRICHGKWHDSKRTILICRGNQRSLSFILAPQSFICVYHDWWHGLRTPREEIAFTARPKIQSQSQIFRYGQSIFCLPLWPNISDIFDLCLHWASVVRAF